MARKLKIGDDESWNSEVGRVSGNIKVHARDFNYKGHTHHAYEDNPQYEIKATKRTISPLTSGVLLTARETCK